MGKGKIFRYDDTGWAQAAEVSPDDAPHRVHKSTLALLKLLKVKQPENANSFL